MRMMRARDRGGLENHVNISDLQIKVRPSLIVLVPRLFLWQSFFLPVAIRLPIDTLFYFFSQKPKNNFSLQIHYHSYYITCTYNVECVWIYVPQWWSVQVAMRNVILIIYHHIKNSKPHQEKQNVKTFLAVIFSCVSKQVSFYTV